MAKEVVLASHNGDTQRLRALLKANPNLVDAVRRAKFALLLAEMKPRFEAVHVNSRACLPDSGPLYMGVNLFAPRSLSLGFSTRFLS